MQLDNKRDSAVKAGALSVTGSVAQAKTQDSSEKAMQSDQLRCGVHRTLAGSVADVGVIPTAGGFTTAWPIDLRAILVLSSTACKETCNVTYIQ